MNVTKTFLPPLDEYISILKRAWDKEWVTNNGELVLELEAKLKDRLNVSKLFYCTNGTIVLQMALKALGITKEVITTPFSYVATTNSILWEGAKPVFVDINETNFNINAELIERAINKNTEAILATHVYGLPCDIEKIKEIGKKYNISIIYDAAHAFGSKLNGESLLSFGDISTCSFHATKVFHTVEGGCIITNSAMIEEKLKLYRQFGHLYDNYLDIGINGKNSELHAAMGLVNFLYIDKIIDSRKLSCQLYDQHLHPHLVKLKIPDNVEYNYAYYPVVFKSEKILKRVQESLGAINIHGRRYFYPSLNELPFIPYQSCPVSEDISRRVFSLPLYYEMNPAEIINIADTINRCLQ